ncbi:MAG: hypothetical protein V4631_16965 [Pseudomonadota bacterium]
MKASARQQARLWTRFEKLAAMPEADRRRSYYYDGMAFLGELMAVTMSGYAIPTIASSEDFSAFIFNLRGNYRQWNQRLMGLMIAFDEDPAPARNEALHEYATTCPWKNLAVAARDFIY